MSSDRLLAGLLACGLAFVRCCAGCITTRPANVTLTPQATTVAATGTAKSPNGVTIPLTAQNIAFSTPTITVPAGAQETIAFNNLDAGVPHNLAVHTDPSATTAIFKGEIVTGPATTTYTYTSPSQPGSYFYRREPHPTTMTGTFVVQ